MNRSIRAQLRNWGLFVATVPLLVFGLSVAVVSLRSQYVQSLNEQAVYARLLATQVRTWLLDIEGVIHTSLRVGGFDTTDSAGRRIILNTLLASNESIEEIAFLDSAGDEVLRTSRSQAYSGTDLRRRGAEALFRSTSDELVPYYSDLSFSEITGEPLVEIGLPVIDRRSGTGIGVIAVEVRARFIWELLRENSLHVSAEVYVLDANGRVFAHPNPSVVLAGTSVPLPLQPGVGSALQPRRALIAAESFALRNQRFLVVVERPIAQALDIFFTTVMLIGPLVFAAIALALWLALRSSRRITEPLTAIAAIAQDIRDNKHYSLPALSNIGRSSWRETATLAETISSMVAQLEEKIAQVRNSLAEREVLLREVHHRVKNNLQIIISLTNIQGHALHDERDSEVFAALQSRIHSMAMVHDQLYQSATLTSISLHTYLESLVVHLSGLYYDGSRRVEITTELEPIEIALEEAVAFGMLSGEVISNSMKHAFSGREHGAIHVALRPDHERIGDGAAVLFEVRDDGVGLPGDREPTPGLSGRQSIHSGTQQRSGRANASPDEATIGFGMVLIRELARQLDASIEFSGPTEGGTLFRMRCRLQRSQQ